MWGSGGAVWRSALPCSPVSTAMADAVSAQMCLPATTDMVVFASAPGFSGPWGLGPILLALLEPPCLIELPIVPPSSTLTLSRC
jgi:hypothetical protein